MSTKLHGKITRLFAVKPDGWFSGVFKDYNSHSTVRIAGVYHRSIDQSIKYDIICDKNVHPKYGEQYNIVSMTPHIPLNKDHILAYLSGDSFKGVGPKIAEKIVNQFGTDSLDVINNEPDRLKSELGLSDRIVSILVKGESSGAIENQIRKLVPNISSNLIKKIADTYCDGDLTIGSSKILNIINNDPYRMLYDIPNVRFKDIDEIAIAAGFDIYDKKRTDECYRFALHQYIQNTHNVFLSTANQTEMNQFYNQVLWNVGYPDLEVNQFGQSVYKTKCIETVNQMFNCPSSIVGISIDTDENGQVYIYDRDIKQEEDGLSYLISECLLRKSIFMQRSGISVADIDDNINLYEKRNPHIKFDSSQRTAIIMGLISPISIIKGGPGHGKTAVLDCILDIFSKYVDDKEPVVSAPTGRAVSVLKKATSNTYGVPYKVATAMRLITTNNQLSKSKEKRSEYEKMKNDFSSTLVVLDECSMLGIGTAFRFMSLFENCQFIFVGDVNQLPSIEYGQFFKDICDCGLIVKTELTENHRANGKLIVENAERINEGDTNIDFSDASQFELCPYDGDYSKYIIDEYVNYVMPNGVIDYVKMSDVCILCPTNNYETGARYLNYAIREIVNPLVNNALSNQDGYEIDQTHIYISKDLPDVKLRVGDRVMYTKNRPDVVCKTIVGRSGDDEMGIYNGDTGIIMEFKASSSPSACDVLILKLDNGKLAYIEGDYIKDMTLAYATTIHKSQGSEYGLVLLSMQHSILNIPGDFASRNLLYTAVTRAKDKVKIIGNPNSFYKCIYTVSNPRNSRLGYKTKTQFSNMKQLMKRGISRGAMALS